MFFGHLHLLFGELTLLALCPFLLVLGFFPIPLGDLAYIRNIDSELNAVNITNFMTLSTLIKLLLAK